MRPGRSGKKPVARPGRSRKKRGTKLVVRLERLPGKPERRLVKRVARLRSGVHKARTEGEPIVLGSARTAQIRAAGDAVLVVALAGEVAEAERVLVAARAVAAVRAVEAGSSAVMPRKKRLCALAAGSSVRARAVSACRPATVRACTALAAPALA